MLDFDESFWIILKEESELGLFIYLFVLFIIIIRLFARFIHYCFLYIYIQSVL